MRLCVLRSGGEYTPDHVRWLARQVPDLHCLSDVPVDGVPTIPLKHDWPGWWAKFEICRPDIEGGVFYFDLDTVVLSVPDASESTVLKDFTKPHLVGSGLMYITEGDRRRVWEHFTQDPARHMRECTKWPRYGDQAVFGDVLNGAQRWGSDVVSYKTHCARGLPAGASVVCFHGKPRPWQAKEQWIPKMETRPMYNDYRDLILKHKGKRIAIMGGGATLDDDITAIKADVVISTNAHGVDHPHDYVIAMDDNHGQGGDMVPFIRARTDAPIIGPQKGADYHLFGWPNYPRRLYTGNVAIWMAWQMGAKSVVLAGVDGYNASPNYLRQVQQVMSVVTCPVRCVGGRLFDKYNPDESFGRYKPDPRITAETASEDDTITVEIVKGTAIEGKRHFSGQTWTGKKITVHRLLRAGVVRAV